MELTVKLGARSYPIYQERGVLQKLKKHLDLDRKVFVLTDSGVPKEYLAAVLAQCPQGYSEVVPMGEGAKSFPVFERLCGKLLEYGFTRKDLLISLGGGVVGDLGGFVAASYMRGIDYVGIPTTTLSQIDSSVGGKTAINLNGVKNIIGAFHQPRAVFMDGETLGTLTPRHFANGLAEALKMGLILDPVILDLFEKENYLDHVDEIIRRAVAAKAYIVEIDETEQNERRSLNFGHTIGHGIESAANLSGLYHGECVALGMLYFIGDEMLKERALRIMERLHLPTSVDLDPEAIFSVMAHDKKGDGAAISVVKVDAPGHYYFERMSNTALRGLLGER